MNAFENIYSEGRDIAIYMGPHLQKFNYPESYPTITSYIETFDKNWVSNTDVLKKISEEGKSYSESIDNTPWSVRQMIGLFDKQIELLEIIRTIIDQLKKTDIYILENPDIIEEELPTNKTLKNKPFLAFVKSAKGIISIIIIILTILVGIYALKDSESFSRDLKKVIFIFQNRDTLNTDNQNE